MDVPLSIMELPHWIVDVSLSKVDAHYRKWKFRSTTESGSSYIDNGTSSIDSGSSTIDNGTSSIDSGTFTIDSGTSTIVIGFFETVLTS